MYNDLKRMIESHARTEGCTEQAALRDLSGELQALASDMGLDLKAALAVTTGDLSDRVEAIQDGREWDDEITLSLALRFLTTIGQGDRFGHRRHAVITGETEGAADTAPRRPLTGREINSDRRHRLHSRHRPYDRHHRNHPDRRRHDPPVAWPR